MVSSFIHETVEKREIHWWMKFITLNYSVPWASFVAQMVKNLPAIWETWVWSLGWDDPLEKGKATHSSILAWRIPWTVESTESQRVRHNWVTFTTSLLYRCSTLRTQICLPPTRDILCPLQFSFQSPESSEHKSHSIICYYLYKNFPLLSTIDTHHHNIDLLLPLEPICNINFKHPALKPSHPMS